MPATVDLNATEVLVEPPPVAHLQLQAIEVLHGTIGTIPTQQAAAHTESLELLTIPVQEFHVQNVVTEVLWLDLTFELQVDAAVVEVLHGSPGAPLVQEAALHVGHAVELLVEPPPVAQHSHISTELAVTYDAGVAAVSDIAGPSATPAEFDGTTSLGWVTSHWWNWVSVPGGSSVANSIQPFPDSGGTSPVNMTANEVLYHCEETSGNGVDSSGNGVSATLTSITLAATGHVGSRAWEFTGSGSMAQPVGGIAIPGDWSVSFWFYNLAPNTAWRTALRGNSSNHHIIVEDGGDRLGVYIGSFQPVEPQFDMTEAAYTGWHHMVMVAKGEITTFYVDGVLVGTVGVNSSDPINAIGNFQVGGQRFADRIDEFALWSRALFPHEALEIYALQSGLYAGVGQLFEFTPDVDGTYTVQLTTVSGLDGSLSTDTANANIGAGIKGFSGAAIRERAKLQGNKIRSRVRFKET